MTATWPSNPKKLLEARYKAFVEGNVDFIVESNHPETRGNLDRNSIEAWSKNSDWDGLKIEDEKLDGDKAKLTFTVRYSKDFQTVNHREHAEFRKNEGKWYYFDSEFPKPESVRNEDKQGRNDPCACGSKKKFKKCCGA